MTQIFADSFDDYDIAQLGAMGWIQTNGGNGFGYGNMIPRDGQGRFGTRGLWADWYNSVGGLYRLIPERTTLFAGIAIRPNSGLLTNGGFFLQFKEGNIVHFSIGFAAGGGQVYIEAGGAVRATTPTFPVAAYADIYSYYEIKFVLNNTTGSVEVRQYNLPLLSWNGDTQNGGTGIINRVQIGGYQQTSFNADDLRIWDDQGTTCNDWVGDCRVRNILPAADGFYVGFDPSTGVDRFACVDEGVLNGDTDYITGADPGNKVSFSPTQITYTGNIVSVTPKAWVRKTDAGNAELKSLLRIGGVDYEGNACGVGDTYQPVYNKTWELNPATGLPWTPAEINTLEFGLHKSG